MEELKAPWLSSYGSIPTTLEYPHKTMYRMVEDACKKYARNIAYEFIGKKTLYAAFEKKIDLIARSLLAIGVKENDRVTICMPNTPQAIGFFYAINKIGAVANMVHPLSAPSEIAFYLNDSESKYILILDTFYNKIAEIRSELKLPLTVVTASIKDELDALTALGFRLANKPVKMPDNDYISWNKFLRGGLRYGLSSDITVDKPDTAAAAILYSGGTTGTTKGILLSNRNFNALALQTLAASGYTTEVISTFKMLAVMPLFHGFGLGVCIHTSMISGMSCILVPKFTVDSYTQILKKKKPNFIVGVPTLYEALLRNQRLNGVSLDYLRGVFCGGDSLSVELKKKVDAFLREHDAPVQIREGYGTTECVTASCLTPPFMYKEGSIGIPYPDTYYKIVAVGTTDEVPYGEEGEICICGPTVMIGYNNNPEETQNVLRVHSDGHTWLHTGDLGVMDAEGFVYFRQRIKRMIITSGYNVYPSQLENIIDAHPSVLLSCVIGVRDTYKMQRIKAFITLRPGVEPSEETKKEIMDFCRKHIAKYAMPRDIEFRAELPKTLVGKVAYRVLEEEEAKKADDNNKQ
ncbi:MAG: AMP-binding protein [Firmicutes bacterium]|nr:AMP-binding protein [Bacillota bacterium]